MRGGIPKINQEYWTVDIGKLKCPVDVEILSIILSNPLFSSLNNPSTETAPNDRKKSEKREIFGTLPDKRFSIEVAIKKQLFN